jgi:hypothetical protein
VSTLEKPTPPQTETGQIPVDQAGIFLEDSTDTVRPPDDFAPDFVNLGAFQLFSEDRRLDLEEFQNVFFHSSRYSPEDIRQWVSPDNSHVYVFIRIGAETLAQKRRQAGQARVIGAAALPQCVD